ncbi:hypothetical protein [Natrinema hispanicum]|uniref:Uncharacterized protein n=1 Tax=Natrinema hispanicum TaxID=392421 RepID=A0A1I0IV81_9EURY|nr:hypothetical protein [Natrinema hispanicum]SEU01219.1 hypothetical protein SAMN04488694_12641 [Natrinema hispanicum]
MTDDESETEVTAQDARALATVFEWLTDRGYRVENTWLETDDGRCLASIDVVVGEDRDIQADVANLVSSLDAVLNASIDHERIRHEGLTEAILKCRFAIGQEGT